jgi:hypothetical protein
MTVGRVFGVSVGIGLSEFVFGAGELEVLDFTGAAHGIISFIPILRVAF